MYKILDIVKDIETSVATCFDILPDFSTNQIFLGVIEHLYPQLLHHCSPSWRCTTCFAANRFKAQISRAYSVGGSL